MCLVSSSCIIEIDRLISSNTTYRIIVWAHILSFDIPQVQDVSKMIVQDITGWFLKDRCINKDTPVSPHVKHRRLILLLTG